MNKKFCDKCGNEIDESLDICIVKIENIRENKLFDLCEKCYIDFYKWINNEYEKSNT